MEIRAMLRAMWRSRTGPILVAAQVAITLAVVVNLAYIVQQRLANAAQPTGLDTDNIFWMALQSHSPEYNHEVAVTEDLQYLRSLPGVVAAAHTSHIPQSFSTSSLPFATDPAVLERGGGVPAVLYLGSADLVKALGVELIAGRGFDPAVVRPPARDFGAAMGTWAPEVVITKTLADELFPKGDALGKTVHVGLVNQSSTIVGIVDLFQHQPIMGRAADMFRTVVLLPIVPPGPNSQYLVRTEPGRRDATLARVESEIAERHPGRYLNSIESLDTTIRRARMGAKVSAATLGVVALFVSAVTVVGIVGLAAFTVATRTRQLGTRRAIGATKFHILRYFLVENWIITSAGAVAGCGLALAVGVKLSTLYFMPRLPLFYLLGGVVILWILGLLAVLVPARRAASISPAVATRTV